MASNYERLFALSSNLISSEYKFVNKTNCLQIEHIKKLVLQKNIRGGYNTYIRIRKSNY